MGNEISHRRQWCRRFRRFERLPEEERTDVPDVPTAQPAQGEGSGASGSPSEKEKPQSAAAGLHNKEQRRKKGTTSCSPPAAQGMARNSELQQPGDNPPATNPAGKTPAPTGGRAAGAEPAAGHPEVTARGSRVQPAGDVGAAGEGQRMPRPLSITPGFYRAPSCMARHCALCRWLESLKTPEVTRKAKPEAGSSQE